VLVFGTKQCDSQRLLASRRLENWSRPIVMESNSLLCTKSARGTSEGQTRFQADRGCGRP
jgi:hypothetical protein